MLGCFSLLCREKFYSRKTIDFFLILNRLGSNVRCCVPMFQCLVLQSWWIESLHTPKSTAWRLAQAPHILQFSSATYTKGWHNFQVYDSLWYKILGAAVGPLWVWSQIVFKSVYMFSLPLASFNSECRQSFLVQCFSAVAHTAVVIHGTSEQCCETSARHLMRAS